MIFNVDSVCVCLCVWKARQRNEIESAMSLSVRSLPRPACLSVRPTGVLLLHKWNWISDCMLLLLLSTLTNKNAFNSIMCIHTHSHTHTQRRDRRTDGRILVVVHMLDILGEINHSPKTTKQTTTATKTRFTLLRNVSREKSAHKRKHNAAH